MVSWRFHVEFPNGEITIAITIDINRIKRLTKDLTIGPIGEINSFYGHKAQPSGLLGSVVQNTGTVNLTGL